MDYYLASYLGDNIYLSGKAVSSRHASPGVCQHHTLQQDLHHQESKDIALNFLTSRTRGFRGRLTLTEDILVELGGTVSTI